MMNYESSECYYRPRYNKGGNNAPTQNPIHPGNQNNVGTSERARPVLGTQPTPSRTTAFKYVEDQGSLLEIVHATPYYVEEPQHMKHYENSLYEQETKGPDHMVSMKAQTLMLMANKAFKKPGGYNNHGRQQINLNFTAGPCFRCQGDHWVRDCPIDQEEKAQSRGVSTSWPRVIRHCADCGIEHLAKNCPPKTVEKSFNPTSLGIIEVIPSPATS